MFEAFFLTGSPLMVDHTPGADVAAGQVVVTNDSVRVCHTKIPANQLGALASEGGLYRSLVDGAIGVDRKVFWDNTAKRITLTATGNKVAGITTTAAAAAGDAIEWRHDPSA
jgi:predicted RecA/RadA family phage recombinase